MYKLCILIFCLAIYCPAFSQCKNAIEVKKSSRIVNSEKTGVLEVKVSSDSKFYCDLKTEHGSGPVQIQRKEGRGTSTVRFDNLDMSKIYLVEIEFEIVDDIRCKKLQKSQIVFE